MNGNNKIKEIFSLRNVFYFIAGLLVLSCSIAFTIYFTSIHYGLFYVYTYLFKAYHFYFSQFDFFALICGFLGLWLYYLVGKYFVSAIEIYVPKCVKVSLGFITGLGWMMVVMELWTMAHLLNRITIIITFLFLLILFAILTKRRMNKVDPSLQGNVTFFYYRRGAQSFAYQSYLKTISQPKNIVEKIFVKLAKFLIGLMLFLHFYHGVFQPVTYWDALILYVGYARKIYYLGGFPFKAVAQVGIGLGANYPHLYSLLSAVIATLCGEWSDIFAQIIPPLCSLFAVILMFHIVLRLSRNKVVAYLTTLLIISIPYFIAYSEYATDYAVAILFTAGFLYCAMMYIETGLLGYFSLATFITAFACHINYLMLGLWFIWFLMIIIAHTFLRGRNQEIFVVTQMTLDQGEPGFTRLSMIERFSRFITQKRTILTAAFCVLLTSPWYIRNYILTGNPVYAFFTNIFKGSKNVNPDVLKSCFIEWTINGDGIGGFGWDLGTKIKSTWKFFVTDKNTSWKLAPVFMGFVVPGLIVFLIIGIKHLISQKINKNVGNAYMRSSKETYDPVLRFGILCFVFFLFLMYYHYAIASFYLYQIIIIIPIFAVMIFFAIDLWNKTLLRYIAMIVCLFIAIMPGLAFSLKGMKLIGPESMTLIALRRPFMDKETFWRLRFGEDAEMFVYINELDKKLSTPQKGEKKGRHLKLLTHENRHLCFNEGIELIHLDDWEIQKTYQMKDIREKLELFKSLGITYYLYVPNEENHPINKKVRMEEMIKEGYLELEYEAGENKLYRFVYEH